MKRVLCLMLCAAMMLAMSGCCVTALLTQEKEVLNNVSRDEPLAVFEIRDENGVVWVDGSGLQSAGVGWRHNDFSYEAAYPVVTVAFNEDGTEKFYRATRDNLGKTLSIYVDGELITSPTVNDVVTGGGVEISGDDIQTLEDAQRIADAINRAIVYEDDYTLTK